MPLDLLPDSLLSLSLRGSEVTHRPAGRSYFYRLWELTPRLTELDLSRCGWLHSHALLPLSKLTQLRRLTLRDCPRIGGEVAYSSIACMLGFRALRALDVRRTQVADSDVSGFCQLPQLAELLLEPRRGGLLDGDTTLRLLGQHRGSELRRLALRGCPLAEQSVDQLPQLLPDLRELDLTRAGVSAERRAWLAQQLTKCVVSCHQPKQDPDPDTAPGAESKSDGPGRRRRRSGSPPDGAAPAGKRPRLLPCRCVRCAAGSDGEDDLDDMPEEEPEEQEPLDLENRPGVIIVNLFDRAREDRAPVRVVRVVNGVAMEIGGDEPRRVDAGDGGRPADDVVPVEDVPAPGGDVPAAGAVDVPAAGVVHVPAAGAVDVPAAGAVDVPAAGAVDGREDGPGQQAGGEAAGEANAAVPRPDGDQPAVVIAAQAAVAAGDAIEEVPDPGVRARRPPGEDPAADRSAGGVPSAEQEAPRPSRGGAAAGLSSAVLGAGPRLGLDGPAGTSTQGGECGGPSGGGPSETASAPSDPPQSPPRAEHQSATDGASDA